jgi:hypothetical protein
MSFLPLVVSSSFLPSLIPNDEQRPRARPTMVELPSRGPPALSPTHHVHLVAALAYVLLVASPSFRESCRVPRQTAPARRVCHSVLQPRSFSFTSAPRAACAHRVHQWRFRRTRGLRVKATGDERGASRQWWWLQARCRVGARDSGRGGTVLAAVASANYGGVSGKRGRARWVVGAAARLLWA